MASIDSIRASDGSGNASVATIQSSRAPAATTIDVDTVAGINDNFIGTMGTPHTFTDPVTSETITVISEATAVDFKGHVDGVNLEIDTIAPGYTDAGSEVGDIVIIRPTTQWGDEVADILDVSHNDDGTLKVADGGTIEDGNGNEQIKFTQTTSAVNELTVKNSATGNAPELKATGDDTNISMKLVPKGTGRIEINGAGPPAGAYVATNESTTSTSYTALATAGPAVTVVVGASGMLEVQVAATLTNSTSAAQYMSFALSGANTVAADDAYSTSISSDSVATSSRTTLLTGLTPGSTTVTAQYRVAGGTGSFIRRNIVAKPV